MLGGHGKHSADGKAQLKKSDYEPLKFVQVSLDDLLSRQFFQYWDYRSMKFVYLPDLVLCPLKSIDD